MRIDITITVAPDNPLSGLMQRPLTNDEANAAMYALEQCIQHVHNMITREMAADKRGVTLYDTGGEPLGKLLTDMFASI